MAAHQNAAHRAKRQRLTDDELRSYLTYDPKTGIFRWKFRVETDRFVAAWNTRYAGQIAGAVGYPGYVAIIIDYTRYLAHRLAWLYVYGRWPDGVIDHINGEKTDNRLANLRDVTRSQNNQNTGIPRHNKSGFKGVCWDKSVGKWASTIKLNGKCINLGRYTTIEEARASYEEASRELHPFAPRR